MELSTDTRTLVEREGYRGVLSVPIFIKGEPYGGLSVYWWQPHPVSKAEIEVMTALGGQAAIAIDNARLFADERSGRASSPLCWKSTRRSACSPRPIRC